MHPAVEPLSRAVCLLSNVLRVPRLRPSSLASLTIAMLWGQVAPACPNNAVDATGVCCPSGLADAAGGCCSAGAVLDGPGLCCSSGYVSLPLLRVMLAEECGCQHPCLPQCQPASPAMWCKISACCFVKLEQSSILPEVSDRRGAILSLECYVYGDARLHNHLKACLQVNLITSYVLDTLMFTDAAMHMCDFSP